MSSYLNPADIHAAIERSAKLDSAIDPAIYSLNSPSGRMGRALMNNIGRLFGDDLRYLECGTERGVAYVSLLNGISPKYTCVCDPWPNDFLKPDFDANVKRFLPDLKYNQLELIIEDCFQVAHERIKSKINFYFYDAMHDEANQKRAYTYFDPLFDDIFLTVIDDWNDPQARAGTAAAFTELGYTILFSYQIPTEYWDQVGGAGNPNTYWNGLGVFLIEKAKKQAPLVAPQAAPIVTPPLIPLPKPTSGAPTQQLFNLNLPTRL